MVSWETLGSATGVLIGLALLGFGVLSMFAAGMSSNPSESANVGKSGCVFAIIGLIVVIVAVVVMIAT